MVHDTIKSTADPLNVITSKRLESNNRKREKKTSFTLFALSTVFLICNSCFLLKQILALTNPSLQFNLERTSRMLLTLNSCVNAIVYSITNTEFRKHHLSYVQRVVHSITCKTAFNSKFGATTEGTGTI